MKVERWAPWAEVGASVAVVVSLIFLVHEVRQNTAVLERQAVLERSAAVNAPFLDDSPVPAILAKIKMVDGPDAVDSAFAARYNLSYEEAARWTRYLSVIWQGLEADFVARGITPGLDRMTRGLLHIKDNQLYWEMGAPLVADTRFRRYVHNVIDGDDDGGS